MSKPVIKTLREWFGVFLRGICMGTADIVPGISGGTIAFIMGFYENLLNSISSFDLTALTLLFKGHIPSFFKRVAWEFLSALLLGIAFALIAFSHFFEYILNHEIYRIWLYSLFTGLICASIFFCVKQVQEWKLKQIFALLIGILSAYALTDLELKPAAHEPLYDVEIMMDQSLLNSNAQIRNYNLAKKHLLNVPESTLSAMLAKDVVSSQTPVFSHSDQKQASAASYVQGDFKQGVSGWLIFCGVIAIFALLLPGISGSYMLNILGVYPLVIGAVADFTRSLRIGIFETDSFYILFSLGLGVISGGLIFSRIVSWFLEHYHSITLATLIGFMIGALKSVWPFWTYDYEILPLKIEKGLQLRALEAILPDFTSGLFFLSCLFALVGFLFVIVVEYIASRKGVVQVTTDSIKSVSKITKLPQSQ